MKNLTILAWILTTIVTVSRIQGQSSISLEEFLESARTSHPFFESENRSPEIASATRDSLKGSQDWLASVSGLARYDEPLLFGQPGESSRDRQTLFSGTLAKSNWDTGSRVSLGYDSGYADAILANFSPNGFSQFQNRLSAEYSFPLLKNVKGKLDRLAYELAEYDVEIAVLQANENMENFLLNLGLKFIDWKLLDEQIIILRRRQDIAAEELEQTREKRADNLIEAVDVLRAEDAERIAKQNRVLANASWKALRIELATLVSESNILLSTPLYDLYQLEPDLNSEAAILRLSANSRALKQLEVVKSQIAHSHEGFENALKADLSFVAGASLKKGDSGYIDSLPSDQPEVSVGLRWSKPLGNRKAKSELIRAKIQDMQIEGRIQSLDRDLRSSTLAVVEHMKELETVLSLNEEQIDSAKLRTEEELRLYNQGRGELNFVLLGRDNEANAALAYANNAASYQKLRLQLRALLDELLQPIQL